ncbi:ABC transporter permease [Longispora albida]|uniref:ABC transporter permease n=1 Tax=Longispora albida TaxID=203523 RepID=UPI0003680978|nr:ABC transporter permease [Longispora albida]
MSGVLRSEWTKLRTTSGTAWLLLGLVVATIGIGWLATAVTTCTHSDCFLDPTQLSLTGVQLGQIVVAVLAVMLFGNEYSTGLIRLTLAATPRRWTVLAAKALVLTGPVLLAAGVAVAGSVVAGRQYQSVPFRLTPVLGTVIYLALIALFSLGLAAIVRSAAVAIGIVLGLCYAYPLLAAATGDPAWVRRLLQIGPTTAGQNIMSTVDPETLAHAPWNGLGVLALWTAGTLLTAAVLLHRRDA